VVTLFMTEHRCGHRSREGGDVRGFPLTAIMIHAEAI